MRCRISLALLSALIILSLILGCGSTKPEIQKTQAVKQLQQGGRLVIGSLQEPNTLNPLLSDLLATAEVGNLLFSGLVVMNDKGQWLPDLAVEVPTTNNGGVSPDGLTITYKLRSGVTWHDGNPFTAEDVKFTWQVIMDPQNKVVSREGYDKIIVVDTPDKQTVVIRFREFYAPYMTLFSTVLPKHALSGQGELAKAAFNRAPIGTGPFKFSDWSIAEAITLEANPSYHRGRPRLDHIIYRVIPDMMILMTQLKTGDLDIVSNIALSQIEQVKALDGVRTVMTPSLIWEHLAFNHDQAMFKDARVRQAVMAAIDRQAIVNLALKNAATVAVTDQSPLSWAYNQAVPLPARDVNRAKELLTQAGWIAGADGIFIKDGQKLSFTLATTAGNKIREAAGSLIVQHLKEAGILAEVRLFDVPAFFGDILKNRRFEAAMYAWVTGADPDNYTFWHSRQIPGRSSGYEGQNYSGWSNPEVDQLTDRGRRTVNLEERKQIYYKLQELVVQEAPVVPLYFRSTIDAVKMTVANYSPNPAPAGQMWNAWEWGLTK